MISMRMLRCSRKAGLTLRQIIIIVIIIIFCIFFFATVSDGMTKLLRI
ncbi:hypothetical protein JXB31_02475 [Candidatus Woesearchaeota archaeon]|nr:hypothetical protein [Candidatus Woesearchaeota archaeon]